MSTTSPYTLSAGAALEAEAMHILREVAAEFEHPCLLFSGGKDSIVVLALAERAFAPARPPFTLVHIDTGHNFDEVIAYRDATAARLGVDIVVGRVQDDIDAGRVVEDQRPGASRNRLQTTTLLRTIREHGFDAVIGGARRDEEKARAKERVFSFRDEHGQWDPKHQRPELWNLYNTRRRPGEHLRVFPLSNWTELDVWRYIDTLGLELPSIYFAHRRPVVERDGLLVAVTPHLRLAADDVVTERTVRFRTVGDATCTAAVESDAATVAAVIEELLSTRISERGATRVDDRISATGMEDRKREGYF